MGLICIDPNGFQKTQKLNKAGHTLKTCEAIIHHIENNFGPIRILYWPTDNIFGPTKMQFGHIKTILGLLKFA